MRFLAFAEPSGVFLGEVVLTGSQVTRALSTPGRLTGTIPAGLVPGWLSPWAVSIYAETDAGEIVGGGFLPEFDVADDGAVAVDCVGRAGYLKDLPWVAAPYSGVQVDPLDVVRLIWAHVQSQPGSDIGVVVDSTTSATRIGTEAEDVNFTTSAGEEVAFEAGPYTLDAWSTLDLGGRIDDLLEQTPADYLEHATWAADGEHLAHRLQLGTPTIGARRDDLRLVVGENITANPPLRGSLGVYASEVYAIGAGTGSTMVRATIPVSGAAGVRRVYVHTDKSAMNRAALITSARSLVPSLTAAPGVDEVSVIDSPLAPLAALTPGDQVLIAGGVGERWERWVRITSIALSPESDTATVRVQEVAGV